MSTAIIKPRWSFVTIGLMVLGFMIFWPLGLAMLAYILWGEQFGGSAEKAEAWVNSKRDWVRKFQRERRDGSRSYGPMSGNAAFDAYRDAQLDRLEAERRRLDEEVGEFHEYMRNLRMARDREEFDRFMQDRKQDRKHDRQSDSGESTQY